MLFPQVRNTRLTRPPIPHALLDEIHGCHLLCGSYSDDEDKDKIKKLNERLDARFANAVQAEAAAKQNRLT
ncbi:hypothetical protein [Amycolatopsis circi]|uniref:hypothetical protein n=1 Tax=Amycolatopsis circi TaxID=871959 RepID=UPI000E250A8C|nr:hypothetical protein [Amycolatopsis circi]